MTPSAARLIYPELPDPLTQGDLQQLFSSSFDERKWAPTVTRTPEAQVALLVQLKLFLIRLNRNHGKYRRFSDHSPHQMNSSPSDSTKTLEVPWLAR